MCKYIYIYTYDEDDSLILYDYIMILSHIYIYIDEFICMQITLWLFNIAMENSPFIDGLPIKKCDFPVHFVCLPEGKPPFSYGFPMVFLFPKSKPTQITCG